MFYRMMMMKALVIPVVLMQSGQATNAVSTVN